MLFIKEIYINFVVILILIITEMSQGITNNNVNTNSGSLSDSKNKDLKVDETRDHEPPPEFYRGGAMNSMVNRNRENERDRERYGFLRPQRYGGYGDFTTSPGTYDTRYPYTGSTTGTGYGYNSNKNINDNNRNKFGYNQYGTSTSSSSTGLGLGLGSNGLTGSNNGYDYSSSQYRPPYGNSIGYGDYEHNYEQGHYYPYDKNNGLDYGHFGLPALGSGGGKEITKSVLLPLAGAALLGIAAAFVANPVLLNLGMMTGRKKRNIVNIEKEDDINEKSHQLAYNGYKN